MCGLLLGFSLLVFVCVFSVLFGREVETVAVVAEVCTNWDDVGVFVGAVEHLVGESVDGLECGFSVGEPAFACLFAELAAGFSVAVVTHGVPVWLAGGLAVDVTAVVVRILCDAL